MQLQGLLLAGDEGEEVGILPIEIDAEGLAGRFVQGAAVQVDLVPDRIAFEDFTVLVAAPVDFLPMTIPRAWPSKVRSLLPLAASHRSGNRWCPEMGGGFVASSAAGG
jgi:hypothetical protein